MYVCDVLRLQVFAIRANHAFHQNGVPIRSSFESLDDGKALSTLFVEGEPLKRFDHHTGTPLTNGRLQCFNDFHSRLRQFASVLGGHVAGLDAVEKIEGEDRADRSKRRREIDREEDVLAGSCLCCYFRSRKVAIDHSKFVAVAHAS